MVCAYTAICGKPFKSDACVNVLQKVVSLILHFDANNFKCGAYNLHVSLNIIQSHTSALSIVTQCYLQWRS